MRLGIFGGSFDPVHYGHLILAELCRERCRLDQVWFMPAATPPHKRQKRMAEPRERVEMLELAIGGHSAFRVSSHEIDRGGLSYTVDTLRQIHVERPDDELFFLLGGDSLHDLASWREPSEICGLATLVAVRRAGSPEPDFGSLSPFVARDRLRQMEEHVVDMPRIDLASRDLRRRVATERSIRYQTPRAVERYIETAGLYRTGEPLSDEPPPSPAH